MLLNLAVALRYLGKKSDAAEVHHAARVLSGAEHASEHPLWLAIDAALAHDADSATKYLADIEVEALDAFYRFLHLLVEVMLEMQAAQPGETKVQFASACKRLKEAQSVYPEYRKDRLSRQVYHCCVRCIARDVGGAGANIWRFLQMF
jgi:hypothetical protein